MEQYVRDEYSKFLFNCEMQGDIWWLTHRAYTFQEWIEEGCPENGGLKMTTSKP